MRRLRPATRTMKYSSRLSAKIARKRVRSRSGTAGSIASWSTRSLNCSQDSSRSRYRSAGRSPSWSVGAPGPTKRPLGARAVTRRFGTVLVNELTSAASEPDSEPDSEPVSGPDSDVASSANLSRSSTGDAPCSSRSVVVRLPVLMRSSWHRNATGG
jgi:hypothetical protein